MRGLGPLLLMGLRLYLREPIAAFFTLAFPVMLVFLFGAIYGNQPVPLLGGRGTMDVSSPNYTGLILGTVGLLSVPITTAGYREQGILGRFRATPIRPLTYLAADVLTNLDMTLLGMILFVLVGWALYRVRFEGQIPCVLLAFVLCGLVMFGLGYLIASLAQAHAWHR